MAGVARALGLSELRFAVRRLRRAPSFSIATIVVLALGIGASTTVFSVVNGVLLRPLPFPNADRIVAIKHTVQTSGLSVADQSDGGFLLYQNEAHSFSSMALTRRTDVNVAGTASDASRAERMSAADVSASLFDVLGMRPQLGRGFVQGEDRVGGPAIVVISDALWRGQFQRSPSVLGQHLMIDGVSREIVGVMPRGFSYPTASVELWLPIQFDPAKSNAGSFDGLSIGRLRDSVTIAAAQSDLARVLPRLVDLHADEIPRAMWDQLHVQPLVIPMRDALVGDVSQLLWILLGSVGLVLVIACANVANLFLVRGEGRQLELAVRGALGSGFAGIVAQCLSESFVLAGVGGLLGVLLAAFGVRLATTAGTELGVPRLSEVSIDWQVLVFAVSVSVVCAAFVSLVPILRARRVSIAMVLREAGRGAASGGPRQGTRNMLVVAQVALALVLVTASGLLARSFERLRDVKPGFASNGVLLSRFALPTATYRDGSSILRFDQRLLNEVRALPGVQAATLSNRVPLADGPGGTVVEVEDRPLTPNTVPRLHFAVSVDRDFFKTLRIPFLTGQTFGALDPQRPMFEAVVSHAFAERYWPDANPIGKRLRAGAMGPWFTVVGEVADVHLEALNVPANDAIYITLNADDDADFGAQRASALLVRGDPSSTTLNASVRRVVRSLDSGLPTYDERSLDDVVTSASARARVTLLLLAVASFLALVLGAVGIYGVMAYVVSLRQREIGVRMALGARPTDVSRMISRHGIGLALTGVVIGIVCTIALTRFLRELLYDVSPTDPLTLGTTSIVLLAVALVASWLPARRAAAVDPADALRRG
ncbi:MAG TPA: ABC transporter permease [Gemmatimonadaceae bacterium]